MLTQASVNAATQLDRTQHRTTQDNKAAQKLIDDGPARAYNRQIKPARLREPSGMADVASRIPRHARTISVGEAARILGISDSTYYQRVRTNDVPFIRIGRTIRVPVAQLERWLNSQGPLR